MPHIYPENCPFPSTIFTPSNIGLPIPQTPLTTPNGIQVQSAVLPQYTLRTDRPSDRPTDGIGDKSVPTAAYVLQ